MRDELLQFYEQELTYLRRTGAEFAQKYSGVASRLQLEATKCDDPHVERLLEGFAFLAARIHLKLNDDFPEISEALLSVMYPQYVRPIPSMGVVEVELDPEKGKLTSGFHLPRGQSVRSRPVDGFRCQFQTCYPLTLWPLRVTQGSWSAAHALKPPLRGGSAVDALSLKLESSPDVRIDQLELDELRFHISADAGLAETVYELLFNNCSGILLRDPADDKRTIELPPSAIRAVGFGEDEAVLPFERREFQGNRLLQEYFSFPAKFLYFDLTGLEALRTSGFDGQMEIVFLISNYEREERRQALEVGVSERTLRLGTVPVVNLFTRACEPIRLTQRRYEYLVVPDARRRDEIHIHSVDEVVGVSGQNEPIRYHPFYSFRHGRRAPQENTFWYAHRRASSWRSEQGLDTYLSFVDLSGRPLYPDADQVTVRAMCHNGDLPSRLPFGAGEGDFEIPGGGPIERVTTVIKPTASVAPPLGKPQLWQLISQLSLNYVSLVDGGADALKQLLRLHNFGGSPAADRQIEGLLSLDSQPAYARLMTDQGLTFARGHDVTLQLDEEEYAGGGAYLFATVLERFLALSVALNTYSAMKATTSQRKQPLGSWPPRAGRRPLL